MRTCRSPKSHTFAVAAWCGTPKNKTINNKALLHFNILPQFRRFCAIKAGAVAPATATPKSKAKPLAGATAQKGGSPMCIRADCNCI